MPTALDNGQRSPRALLAAVVRRLRGRKATVPTTLWIGPQKRQAAFPDPWPVFDALRPEAEELTWVMWGWMDATGNEDISVDLSDLETRIYSSPFGVPISWDALADLLRDLVQVIDGNFVGCSDPSRVPRFPDTDLRTLHESCEIAVTAFDSSDWIVSAPPSIIERLQLAFPNSSREAVPYGFQEAFFVFARELDRHLGERLCARVDRERISRPQKYALTIPLPHPNVVLIEVRPDGIVLLRFTASRESGGDSWFSTISDAQQAAASEYGEALGDWHTIPPDEPDALTYALRARNDA
jgi:hypothetical protein